jgi:hypothetical protein
MRVLEQPSSKAFTGREGLEWCPARSTRAVPEQENHNQKEKHQRAYEGAAGDAKNDQGDN